MHIDLLVVPYDSAHRGIRTGAGPTHLIDAGLQAELEGLGHHVSSATLDPPPDSWRAEIGTAFELAARIAAHVRVSRELGHLPIVLAGNCMAASGVVAGLGAGTGVLWLDAHGDFNTPETTIGGFLDGMSLATVTGRCWTSMTSRLPDFAPVPESAVWLLGARDLDVAEADALRQSAVTRVPVAAICADLGARVRSEHPRASQLYVHLDLDVLDPADGRVSRYATDDGVPLTALRASLESIGASARPAALTLSAYDPAYDVDGRVCLAAFGAIESFVTGCELGLERG